MKKIILVLCFLGFLQANAQVTFKPGIHAGMNISKLSGIDIPSKTDFFAGAFGEIKFSKKYALQPEITYSRQGAKGDYTYSPSYSSGTVIADNVDVSLQYISLSINNKILLFDDLYLLLGEFNDFIVVGKIYENDSSTISKGQDIDYGLFGGFEYSITKEFAVDVRFKKGLADALDDHTGFESKITNQAFQIGASYTFGKK